MLGVSLLAPLVAVLSLFRAPATDPLDRAMQATLRLSGVQAATGDAVGAMYSCSSFVIAPHRVLSAAHCLGDAMSVDHRPAILVKADPYDDLLLLDVPGLDAAPIPLADRPAELWEPVTAIGFALGWGSPAALVGRVIIRSVAAFENERAKVAYQLGFAHGMSGGPVINHKGQLVAVVEGSLEGIGVGPDLDVIRQFLSR
jgi:S1-C subfamily serine protease